VRLTCLLVDDSPDFLSSATRLLEAEGVRVVGQCRTRSETFDRVSSMSPDVILVDVELGCEDGVLLATELASQFSAPAVILISSRDRSDRREMPLPNGVRGFLPKSHLGVDAPPGLLPELGQPDHLRVVLDG
jgi:DNA-binding NarL/FixJ family response regulator